MKIYGRINIVEWINSQHVTNPGQDKSEGKGQADARLLHQKSVQQQVEGGGAKGGGTRDY